MNSDLVLNVFTVLYDLFLPVGIDGCIARKLGQTSAFGAWVKIKQHFMCVNVCEYDMVTICNMPTLTLSQEWVE